MRPGWGVAVEKSERWMTVAWARRVSADRAEQVCAALLDQGEHAQVIVPMPLAAPRGFLGVVHLGNVGNRYTERPTVTRDSPTPTVRMSLETYREFRAAADRHGVSFRAWIVAAGYMAIKHPHLIEEGIEATPRTRRSRPRKAGR